MCRRLLLLGLLALPSAASAHRLDEYLQATLMQIGPAEVRLEINLTPGVGVAAQVLPLIDPDGDGVVSAGEAAAYAEHVRNDLWLRLDQRDLTLKLTASQFPEISEIRTGVGIIQMEFTAALSSLAGGAHELNLDNRHLPAVSVYLVNAGRPESPAIKITRQTRNRSQSLVGISFLYQAPVVVSRTPGIVIAVAASLIAVVSVAWRFRKCSGGPAAI